MPTWTPTAIAAGISGWSTTREQRPARGDPRQPRRADRPRPGARRCTSTYDSHILRGVAVQLPPARRCGPAGPQRYGKTTLIRTMMGCIAPAGGHSPGGQDVTGWRPSAWRGWHRLRARRPRHLPNLSAREPGDLRARRPDGQAHWDRSRVLVTFRARPSGCSTVASSSRRRAADAGDRPRADDQPAACWSSTKPPRAWRRSS